VKPRDTDNPHNRFRKVAVEYDEGDGPPPSQVTLLEDHSRTILSENDSPDIGFRFSANPYRGCLHACAYCLRGDTPLLLADGRTKPIAEVRVGDALLGTRVDGKNRYYVRTNVVAHWSTVKPAYRITLADATELVASADHRFLTNRGWKHVLPASEGQRPYLTASNSFVGTGRFAAPPAESTTYRRGYLCGLIRGDGTLHQHDDSDRRRGRDVQFQVRLAMGDQEPLDRARRYLADAGVATTEFQLAKARPSYKALQAIRTSSREAFDRISRLIELPAATDPEWERGFLAGIFDAEGGRSYGVFRISNMDTKLIDRTIAAMERLGFDVALETRARGAKPIVGVRLRGGLSEQLRFYHSTAPALSRKWDLEGVAIKTKVDLKVVSIEPLGKMRLFDITTGTGDFIANGVVSHNCYARVTHEYLDLGAGTDFDTKIVVKHEAPELLRAAFDKPSWQGELVMFSGVTDCYQAIEKELELTKRCLEVCLEYKNPVNVISKSALVERDIELFLALQEHARFHVAVSLAFTDNELSRALEPWAPSPDRRFKVIETLAKAGVNVGVVCAPIIPGVNDNQLVKLLERAASAGATSAGWVLLRLPGAVKQVFEDRVRVALPLAGDKILHRIRETRGGTKLYDSAFHTRGRGQGPYAEMIATMFDTTVARLGLCRRNDEWVDPRPTTFVRPPKPTNQLSLF
jgi:DNA repair photolyase